MNRKRSRKDGNYTASILYKSIKNYLTTADLKSSGHEKLKHTILQSEHRGFVGNDDDQNYAFELCFFIKEAMNDSDIDIKRIFFDSLFDELLKHDSTESLAPSLVLMFEGLSDLLNYDFYRLFDEYSTDRRRNSMLKSFHIYYPKYIYLFSKYNPRLLIIGETGTSKRMMARAIQKMSSRRNDPCREVNCAAIPRDLIESELFGYKKGAFTGASKDKKGILSFVNGGTLILDELGSMSKYTQAKLLQVIEEKEYHPLGSNESIQSNIRYIATIKPDDIEEEKILKDLYFRLGQPDVLLMPTLNERLDVTLGYIIKHSFSRLLAELQNELKITIPMTYSNKILPLLKGYKFIGNYRELENIMRRALKSAVLDSRTEILPKDLKISEALGELLPINDPASISMEDIKLMNVIDYADEGANKIIQAKVLEVLRSGKDIKNTVIAEGLRSNQYRPFIKRLGNRLETSIGELKKQIKS